MKNKFRRSGIPILMMALMLLTGLSVSAQYSETREFVKRFRIQPETEIDITNKYGLIELNTWKKDSVVIRFRMAINEKKPDKLRKTLDNLDFNISHTQHYLVVKTQVDKYRSQIESELKNFKETILQSNGSIRIDLEVWLPDEHELRLENKFGDILMNDYHGEMIVNLSNGKLKAGTLDKKATLNLSFADAVIGSMDNGSISSNYSDLSLRNTGSIRLDSKSSKVEIQNAGGLNITSRRDKYRIRQTDIIEASGNFSHFLVNELKEKASMRLSFGSLEMEKVLPEFSNIYIESKSTDLNLVFSQEAKFNFEITETKTDLNLGSEIKVEEKDVLDSKSNKVRHTGYFNKKTKEEQLIINAEGGETNVRGE